MTQLNMRRISCKNMYNIFLFSFSIKTRTHHTQTTMAHVKPYKARNKSNSGVFLYIFQRIQSSFLINVLQRALNELAKQFSGCCLNADELRFR